MFAILLTLGLGVLAGFLLYKYMQVGLYGMAFFGGYLIGSIIYQVMFAWFESDFLLGFCTFSSAWVAAILCYKWQKGIIITVTAFIGSYFLVRGVSLFVGGFPNEFEMYEEVTSGTFQFDKKIYFYFGGILVGWLVGVLFQAWWSRHADAKGKGHYTKV